MRWNPATESLTFHKSAELDEPALWKIPAHQLLSVRETGQTITQRMIYEKVESSGHEDSGLWDKAKELTINLKYGKVQGRIIVLKCVSARGMNYEVNVACEVGDETAIWNGILNCLASLKWYSTISTCLSPVLQTPFPGDNQKFSWFKTSRKSSVASSVRSSKYSSDLDSKPLPKIPVSKAPEEALPVPPKDTFSDVVVNIMDKKKKQNRRKKTATIVQIPLNDGLSSEKSSPDVGSVDSDHVVVPTRVIKQRIVRARPKLSVLVPSTKAEEEVLPTPRPQSAIIKKQSKTMPIKRVVVSKRPHVKDIFAQQTDSIKKDDKNTVGLKLKNEHSGRKDSVKYLRANKLDSMVSPTHLERHLSIQKELAALDSLSKRLQEVTSDIVSPVSQNNGSPNRRSFVNLKRNASSASSKSIQQSIQEVNCVEAYAGVISNILTLQQGIEKCQDKWVASAEANPTNRTFVSDAALKATRKLLVEVLEVNLATKKYIKKIFFQDEQSGMGDVSKSSKRKLLNGMTKIALGDFESRLKEADALRVFIKNSEAISSSSPESMISVLDSLLEGLNEVKSVCRLLHLFEQSKLALLQ